MKKIVYIVVGDVKFSQILLAIVNTKEKADKIKRDFEERAVLKGENLKFEIEQIDWDME